MTLHKIRRLQKLNHRPILVALILSSIFHLFLIAEFHAGSPVQDSRIHPSRLDVTILPPESAKPPVTESQSADVLPEKKEVEPVAQLPVNKVFVPAPNAEGWYGAARYYELKELDKEPVPIGRIDVEYPIAAKEIGVTGQVKLELLLNEQGDIDLSSIVSSNPPNIFDAAVMDAFKGRKFAPGEINGVPVKSRLVIAIAFDDRARTPAHPR